MTPTLSPPREDLARLERENRRLLIENAALERFCGQLSEIIDRLSAEKRKRT
jgi:hypothetical protein